MCIYIYMLYWQPLAPIQTLDAAQTVLRGIEAGHLQAGPADELLYQEQNFLVSSSCTADSPSSHPYVEINGFSSLAWVARPGKKDVGFVLNAHRCA